MKNPQLRNQRKEKGEKRPAEPELLEEFLKTGLIMMQEEKKIKYLDNGAVNLAGQKFGKIFRALKDKYSESSIVKKFSCKKTFNKWMGQYISWKELEGPKPNFTSHFGGNSALSDQNYQELDKFIDNCKKMILKKIQMK